MKQILFPKSQRSTFQYWFHHWYWFNKTAKDLHCWKLRYLFHDIEKPFLRLFLPYEKVQKIHRRNNKHHLEYKDRHNIDWVSLVVDWESSHFSKEKSWRTCIEECNRKFEEHEIDFKTYHKIFTTARKLGLKK